MDFQISGVCCHFETLSLGGRLVDEIMAEACLVMISVA